MISASPVSVSERTMLSPWTRPAKTRRLCGRIGLLRAKERLISQISSFSPVPDMGIPMREIRMCINWKRQDSRRTDSSMSTTNSNVEILPGSCSRFNVRSNARSGRSSPSAPWWALPQSSMSVSPCSSSVGPRPRHTYPSRPLCTRRCLRWTASQDDPLAGITHRNVAVRRPSGGGGPCPHRTGSE